MQIKTERLILRPWKKTDWEAFAKLNADPRVMEYFPATLTREESDQVAKRMSDKIDEQGWGFWAVSIRDGADFIGIVGICQVPTIFSFAPAVEIGWRLAHEFWGQGYALEGAQASLQFGFDSLNLSEIVSFTTTENRRSRKVMEKLGMHRLPADDFDNPKLPMGHPLCPHVLYRINQTEWKLPSDFFYESTPT